MGGEVEWAGVRFNVVDTHDAHFFRTPGLYGFVRPEPYGGRSLLYLCAADVIAVDASPGSVIWAEALGLGMKELHIAFVPDRLDRLQLADRIVRRLTPILNLVGPAAVPPAPQRTTRRVRAVGE